jgi:hypothetical protein
LPADHKRIQSRGEIGRRQHLPHGEFDNRLVLRRHATHASGRVVPPMLVQQKRLREHVKSWIFPLWFGKTPILRRWLDQGPWPLVCRRILQRSFEELSRDK